MGSSIEMPPELTGEWSIEAAVGSGATAVVFRARHARTGAVGALKLFRHAPVASAQQAERELLALLDRRWGPRLLDAGQTPDGASFLVTTWTEGEPLDVRRSRSEATRLRDAAIVAHAVGRGLAELHGLGVWHGDVKPQNVLVHARAPDRDAAEARGATLIDLGLAISSGSVAKGGTYRYAAPELVAAGEASPASDVFALGVLLAELIAPGVSGEIDAASAARGASAGPGELPAWIGAMLSRAPGGRPSAAWIAERAARYLQLPFDPADRAQEREHALRRSYLCARATELLAGARLADEVAEPCRGWMTDALAMRATIHVPREAGVIAPSDALTQSRWLVSLVGPAAAAWPVAELGGESSLAARLVELARARDAAGWTLDDLLKAAPSPLAEPPAEADRAVWMVRELVRARPDDRAIAAAEDLTAAGKAPQSVVVELVSALLRAGETGRAWLALSGADPSLDALRAEVARRRGEREVAIALAESAIRSEKQVELARATLARLRWDVGDARGAEEALGDAADAGACEVRALLALRAGAFDAGVKAAALGRAVAADEMPVARLWLVQGLLEHAAGRSIASAESFGRAVDLARRAGACAEEATALVGESAAAADCGEISRALSTATRAMLLFERLGKKAESSRAWLQRAATLSTVGAAHEAELAAREAIARSGRDAQSRAYARWAIVEARAPGDPVARAETILARDELQRGGIDDRVRAAARALVWAPESVEADAVTEIDALAESLPHQVRCDWWGARARMLAADGSVAHAERVLDGVVGAALQPGPLASRGPALDAGARLAVLLGRGDVARRLESARREAASRLAQTTPVEFAVSMRDVAWAHAQDDAGSREASSFDAIQIAQLEVIVRSLSTRDSLKSLLAQVLDALVLWTGVERGLLLLRAHGGKLVPRAARNLAKQDLKGDQLALSMTLAQRAMQTGEMVVAADALSALGDVHASVHALRLRSVLAVPLIARGEALGVAYLDDRARAGAFGERERAWVRLLAGQAAMAIADARDQVLLRRAARRAERARLQLAEALAARDAELDVTRLELSHARGEGETRFRYEAIAGRSEPMRALLKVVDRVTASDVPVLVLGESGTGKELIARAMHENGPRSRRAFVSENCGAVPESLLESILFGHVKGAFTGASQSKAGLFEVADGGTMFLDEIGEMPLSMQTKLLRVLQDGEVRPVGSERTRKVDLRVIAATHRDLEAMVADKTFREDLYYRLNVVTLRVPPLRERPGDIALVVQHFLAKHAGGRKLRLSRAAMDRLCAFPWPGNVRQLENEIRRALVLMSSETLLEAADLSPEVQRGGPVAARESGFDLKSRVDTLERELLISALENTRGNQTKAAELLGLSRFGLQKMLKRLGIGVR